MMPNGHEHANGSEAEQSMRSLVHDAVQTEATPLSGILVAYMEQILQYGNDDDAQSRMFDTLLSHTASNVEHPADAAYLIYLGRFLIRGPEMGRRAWEWALEFGNRFPVDAKVLSVLADLGHYLRTVDAREFSDIQATFLRQTHERAVSLNSQDAPNLARAGAFYFAEDEIELAVAAYEDAFQIDPADGTVALALSDLYLQLEQPEEALSVLTACSNAGDDSNVTWEAAMVALDLGEYEQALQSLDRIEDVSEFNSWLPYYRASALLQLERYDLCLPHLEQAAALDPPGDFHLQAIRMCALIGLEEMGLEVDGEVRKLLQAFLDVPLRDVSYLSMEGLGRVMEQVWEAVSMWDLNDPERLKVERRNVLAGLSPAGYFEVLLDGKELVQDLSFYQVVLEQPLDENWNESPGCLPGQETWLQYVQEWGVMALDDQDAVNFVMEYQSQCGSGSTLLDIIVSEETYTDRPGIIWQSLRSNPDVSAC